MKRWLWNILCACSLLIFALSMTLWARSYFVWETVERIGQPAPKQLTQFLVRCSRGAVVIDRWRSDSPKAIHAGLGWAIDRGRGSGSVYDYWSTDVTNVRVVGFQFRKGAGADSSLSWSYVCFVFPLWVCLIFGVPPVLWWRRWRRMGGRGFAVEVGAAAFVNMSGEGAADANAIIKS